MIKATYTIYLWSTLLKQIHNLQLNRNQISNDKDVHSLNITIIILLTTCIESFLYTILLDILPLEKRKGNRLFEDRIIKDLESKLDKATWTNLDDLTLLITGKKLKEYCNNSDWQKITILYGLRNKIAHGKNIQKYIGGLKSEYKGVYAKIMKEMTEQKLTDKTGCEMFSSSVIDNFTDATKKFIKTIATSFSTQFDFYNQDEFVHNLYERELDFIESLTLS